MVGAALGKEGFELLPDGLDEVRWECGHGACSFRLGSLENSPHDGASVPALHHDALPIDGSSKMTVAYACGFSTRDGAQQDRAPSLPCPFRSVGPRDELAGPALHALARRSGRSQASGAAGPEH